MEPLFPVEKPKKLKHSDAVKVVIYFKKETTNENVFLTTSKLDLDEVVWEIRRICSEEKTDLSEDEKVYRAHKSSLYALYRGIEFKLFD